MILATSSRCQLLALLALLSLVQVGWGQVDDAFWFVAPEVTNSHGDDPVLLRFATFDEPAVVTIEMPANPAEFPPQVLEIGPNSAASLDLTPWLEVIENKPFDGVHNKGIHIVSTANVSAYYEVNPSCGCNPDIFALKGANAEGTNFLVPFQTFLNNTYSNSPSGFDIVATMPDTEVTITPTKDLQGGHPAGEPYTIILPEAGSTYSARATGTSANAHASGTVLEANQPIAVTIHDDSANGAPFGGCSDLMGDQLVPVEITGTEYIAIRGYLNGPDRVYLLAIEDDTDIQVGGAVVATLQAGETYSHTLNEDAAFFESSAPVYVWHLSGFGCEVGGAVLPSIKCTGSPEVVFVRSTGEFIGLNILVPAGGEGDFTFNGDATVITSDMFAEVPGTDGTWLFAQIESASFVPQLEASRLANASQYFHLGIIHGGAGSGTRYGYFSDYGALRYQAENSAIEACEGQPLVLGVQQVENGLYNWTGPNGFSAQGTSVTTPPLDVNDSGDYVVQGYIGECAIENDTVEVVVHPIPDAPVIDFESTLCEGDPMILVASGDAETYAWTLPPDGDLLVTGDTLSFPAAADTLAGIYTVQIADHGCLSPAASAQVYVITSATFELPPDVIAACEGAEVSYDPDHASFIDIVWTLPSGTTVQLNGAASIEIDAMTADDVGWWVAEGFFNGCPMGADSIEVTILSTPAPPIIEVPPALCEGDELTLTVSSAGNGELFWLLPDGVILQQPSIEISSADPADAGVYSAWWSSPDGCVSSLGTALVDVTPLPSNIVSDWSYGVSICPGEPLVLELLTFDVDYDVAWTFAPADGGPNLALPGVTTSTLDYGPGLYTIVYTTGSPCDLTATGVIEFVHEPCEIFIPNVFSPSNGDSRNNAFRIPGLEAFINVSIRIYNRWGQLMFTHDDFGQSAGWDPSVAEASEGTYYWVIDIPNGRGYLSVETIDGIEIFDTPEPIRLQGTLMLVR